MIKDVYVRRLKLIADERGYLMEMFRSDWEEFKAFGQVYITAVYSGVIKGWHYHKHQEDNFICVAGMAKVVLYDSREDSLTRGEINEFFLGTQNPIKVTIPPGVMHGFKGISPEMTLIVNVPTRLYNYSEPDEFRLPAHTDEIPYDWNRKDG
ncbi:MAG: dTDP-4-dehydrorhamnose 3,5-epimerase family protein [Ardenticatenaceae bacterium]|nr:dTDP-4-dehydrorhamnose 3,5-epimerase family protein [Ardenticatenaceae bacterium]